MNLIAYYQAHPQVAVRRKYEEIEKEIRRILTDKKKDQRTVVSEKSRIPQARIIERIQDGLNTGL